MGEEDSGFPEFVEVKGKRSGNIYRFAAGTKAGFAVQVINRKLGLGIPEAWYIEAVKEGEEPVCFGPNSVLASYGNGWMLQTFHGFDLVPDGDGSQLKSSDSGIVKPENFVYHGKILLAFVFIFSLGAIFTLALECLPLLINLIQTLW